MSMRYPGGVISATPPTITPPVDGEGGTASGVWTLETQFQNAGVWPKPVLPRELYVWGGNSAGQLGLNDTADRSSPVQVGALTTWNSVAASATLSVAIKTDGTIWSWGQNTNGQLGQNTAYGQNRSSPVQIGALTNWLSVSAGGYETGSSHCLAIKTDGTLWTWGNNINGQLGLNDTANRSSPVQIGSATDWAKVSAGQFSSLAVKTNGTLWAWGRNEYGQLGQGNTIDRSSPVQVGSLTNWSNISISRRSSISIKTDGTLWSWGFNLNGQLGQGNTINRSSPVQVGALTDWSTVSMAPISCFAVKTGGTLWAWGYNSGRLGTGDSAARSSPVQVGALTNWSLVSANSRDVVPYGGVCMAIKTDGTLWGWGTNQSGQIGIGNTLSKNSPVQVGSNTNWVKVSAGNSSTLATTKG